MENTEEIFNSKDLDGNGTIDYEVRITMQVKAALKRFECHRLPAPLLVLSPLLL